VGDGTGKGVPAAMVVQTVQALWTAGLSDPNWDPLQWLQSVNRTLRTLGRQTPHTLTLGLVIVDAAEIVYYSAGPMPLFMIGDTRIGESTKSFSGEGHLLGIYSDPQIKPVTLHLPEFSRYTVMLATDSIIPKRALSKDRRMYDLLTQVSRGGMGAIRSLPSDEDKILLLIQRAESLDKTA
jgi:serine phosphatase RsbU (regulator of sigma subunit)